MELAPQQKVAFDKIMQWYKTKNSPVFVLAGYAGTGKTTLAKYIASEVGAANTIFCAFTGKAAKVLQEKGCANAGTIHSFLYAYIGKDKNNDPIFGYSPTQMMEVSRLIIVDEYSMLSKELIDHLIQTGEKVLFLGDPFQLPPVKRTQETMDYALEPDFFLDEVHRQALDSGIIRAATDVRLGKMLPKSEGDEFSNLRRIDEGELMNVDQVIVGKNMSRSSLNKRMRDMRGMDGTSFNHGEKIICLRNNKSTRLMLGLQCKR